MNLIGIISHQGTKEHGHYVAITKKGNEWISCNDAITTQIPLTHLHQSQAYVLIYRKIEHSADAVKETPSDAIIANQQLSVKTLKPPHTYPDPPKKIPPKENLPAQEGQWWGLTPTPHRKDPPQII